MIKLKGILSEAYAWERQEGKPLPTLAEVQAAYQAKLREDAHNEDPDEKDHEYEEPPFDEDDDDDDDRYMYEAEDKANKDYDGDGEVESGSEEYLGSRDKAIKAAADTTAYGNYVNKDRAKSQLTNKDVDVYGIDDSGKGHKITNASELNLYSKFTIKSKNNSKSLEESFNKRMLGNLKGSEYILSETFKRK